MLAKKTQNPNLSIPHYIYKNTDEKIICNFLRAIYDDESHISLRRKAIKLEVANKQIVADARDLFLKIGISYNPILEQRHKFSQGWYFEITSQNNFLLFKNLIGSNISEKGILLEKLVNSYQTPVAFARLSDEARERVFSDLKIQISNYLILP